MPCFCVTPASQLQSFNPTLTVDARAVPPQLAQLLDLLGLEDIPEVRLDETMARTLPRTTPDAWMRATLTTAVPNARLPGVMPSGAGPMIKLAMRVSASPLPLHDPKRLLAELRQMAYTMAKQLLPGTKTLQSIPRSLIQNMTMAARLTLALRAKGVCPMALARVDMRFAADLQSQERLRAALALSATVRAPAQPRILLAPPQLALAQTLSAIAPLSTLHEPLNLPPASDPNFAQMLKDQLASLAAMAVPTMPAMPDELLALAATLESLDTIKAAFGDDALTPQGVARVNAMLTYVARLQIPIPTPALEAMALQSKMLELPKIEDVRLGAQTVQSSGLSMVSSLSTPAPGLPIAPLLEAITALTAVLSKALGQSPFGLCDSCNFPIDRFMPA